MLFACLKLSASPRRAGYQESPALAMMRTGGVLTLRHIHHTDISVMRERIHNYYYVKGKMFSLLDNLSFTVLVLIIYILH